MVHNPMDSAVGEQQERPTPPFRFLEIWNDGPTISEDLECHLLELVQFYQVQSQWCRHRDADFIFQQNSQLAHTFKVTNTWFNASGVNELGWPEN